LRTRALALILGFAAAGCFSGRPISGQYGCTQLDQRCPANYTCNTTLWRCIDPNADLGAGGGGGGVGGGGGGGVIAQGEVGSSCVGNSDCLTANCDNMVCELATGPPYWRTAPVMFFQRQRPAVSMLPDKSIMAAGGGYSGTPPNPVNVSVEQYLPPYLAGGNKWQDISESSTVQAPMVFSNQAASAGLLNGTVFIAGGLGNEQKLQKFDNASRTFQAIGTTTGYFIDQAGSAVLADQLYVFGGFSTATVVGGTAERYDSTSGWAALGNLQTARRALAGVVGPDGLIYAIGGHGAAGNDVSLDTIETYEPHTNQWIAAKPLPMAIEDLAAVTGPDNRLYILGGISGGTTLKTVQAFTPSLDRWALVSPMSDGPRSGLGAVVATDGLIYVIGGADGNNVPLNSTEVYGPRVISSATSILIGSGNFAANANVSVYNNTIATGAVIGMGTTDSMGTLTAAIPLPSLPSGTHVLTVMDDHSRFPVQTTIIVP
jgi:hypothetical protein